MRVLHADARSAAKARHVVIVNNGDGQPVVFGTWERADGANRWADRYAKRHPSRIGVIRVQPLQSPNR